MATTTMWHLLDAMRAQSIQLNNQMCMKAFGTVATRPADKELRFLWPNAFDESRYETSLNALIENNNTTP